MYLRENPWNPQRRLPREAYEAQWLEQGKIAINSILRDWVKGQVTAIECGLMNFDTAFLPHLITRQGKTVGELIGSDPSLLQITGPAES